MMLRCALGRRTRSRRARTVRAGRRPGFTRHEERSPAPRAGQNGWCPSSSARCSAPAARPGRPAGSGRRTRRPAPPRPGPLRDGGQQGVLGHRHGHLVVAAARPRSCRPARSSRRAVSPRPRPGSRAGVGVPAEHGVRGGSAAGPRPRPVRSGGVQPRGPASTSASVRTPARPRRRGGRRSSSAASARSAAMQDGSSPTTGTPAATYGCSASTAAPQDPPAPVELAGGDPGQPAAGRARG